MTTRARRTAAVGAGAGADLGGDAQLTRIAALAEPIRRTLYRFVADHADGVSREQAAEGLGLPRHVAKFHLDKLAEDGLLDTEYRRPAGRTGPGAGRPTKLYRCAQDEVGASVPERHYDLAADILARAVTESRRTRRPIDAVLTDIARQTGATLADQPGDAAPVDALCDLLAAHGYEPAIVPDDGRPDGIILRNCPFHRLAQEHTELVCGLNLDLLAGVLDRLPEVQLRPRLDPAPGRCCVVLAADAHR